MTRQIINKERGVMMALSKAYLEWEKQTEERGIQSDRQVNGTEIS
jgi:hypothetical protein